MNELEKLSTGLMTKADKVKFIDSVKEEILSGNVNPLQVEIYLKNLSDIIDKIRKDDQVKEYVLSEAEKNGKTFDFMGNKIEVSQKRTFDFSTCGHTKYNRNKAELKEIETFLKALKPEMQVFDEETGERLNPPTFTTSQFLKITQK